MVTFLNRLAAGEAPVIDGRGDQSMDFVHVTDVARRVGMALDSEATGEVLNVGTGTQTSIADLAELLMRSLGSDVQPVYRPREVLVTRRQASIERIEEVLGWRPQVDIEEGIASVLEWHKRTSRGPAGLTGMRHAGSSPNPWNPLAWVRRRARGREGTWVGPFCLLDGSGGLVIGRGCDLAAGVQVYTHSTARTLRHGPAVDIERRPVTIGDRTFIGANASC